MAENIKILLLPSNNCFRLSHRSRREKSLTDNKAVGNRISLVSPSTGFKGCSYPGGEIQIYPISRDTAEGKGDGQANGRSVGRAQSHPCGRF